MLRLKIENAHWAEKTTTTRCGIRETTTTRNFVLWLFFKQPQRVVVWKKQPQSEMSFELTVYKFSNLLINNTCNVGPMKNNGEAHLFLQELLQWHLDLHFIFFERHLHFLSMQYLLQWQLTNPCLHPDVNIEADRRDSELEGTSCASMKLLSAVVNSMRACSRSTRPCFVPNR